MTISHTASSPAHQGSAQLEEIADRAVDTARRWLRVAAGLHVKDPSADRLAAVLGDERGVDFTVGFVDRVIRTEDTHAAGAALASLVKHTPPSLPALDPAQIRAGAALVPIAPQIVVPAARARMRQMLRHMIVDARPAPFGRAVAQTAGAPVTWSIAPEAAGSLPTTAATPSPTDSPTTEATSTSPCSPTTAEVVVEEADAFAARVASGRIDDTVGARVRGVGAVEDALRRSTQDRPEVAIRDGPVTASGEVELRHYVHEQAVSMTLHRFGTQDRSFHALAERLRS